MIDLTGCAHLFGGEAALLTQVEEDCAALGLSVRAGIGDTPGGAWALARFASSGAVLADPKRSGDDIAQEARATRARAAKRRHWERGGALPTPGASSSTPPSARPSSQLPLPPPPAGQAPVLQGSIAAPGYLRQALAPLPLAALRLQQPAIESLTRLGIRTVADLAALPRASLARRFGADVLKRLDQAYGLEPEPVSPAAIAPHFATRLTLPDPIGTLEDISAGVDRLLTPLCAKLAARSQGARRLALQAFRADGNVQRVEVTLARATDQPDRIRPLLVLKYDQIDPGFGIDCLRLEAVQVETLSAVQHRGPIHAPAQGAGQGLASPSAAAAEALEDLLGKLGARLGSDAVTRLHPAESHLPEKAATAHAAAWSVAWDGPWPTGSAPRPLVLHNPEPVQAPDLPTPPAQFRWRRRDLVTRMALGPERILPEWWFDNPEWRSGPRDYWRVEVGGGERLWLYYAHGADISGGWFCHGQF